MSQKRENVLIDRRFGSAVLWLGGVVLFVVGGCGLAAQDSDVQTYEHLIRAQIHTSEPDVVFAQLEAAGYDVLHGSLTTSTLDVVVSHHELEELRKRHQSVIEMEHGRPLMNILQEQESIFAVPTGYLDLAGVIDKMNATAAAFPAIAQVVDLTATYNAPLTFEGRHLFAMKISDNVTLDEDEPVVMVVSTHHAREIVTPVIALYAIDQLTQRYGSDPQLTAAVNNNEIWIAPVWNPDGYNHVFTVDNMWRKNRRVFSGGIGVDQNRNYPQGWHSWCSGSTDPRSNTYKGPSPASEAETQTIMTWSLDQRFAKVIDYHSSGRETLYSYSCHEHPFTGWMEQEAIDISNAAGYQGAVRPPSADGEHYQWQLAQMGSYAFLIETHTQFQPSYQSADNEAAMVWPSILWTIQRPIPISGHVTDAVTGAPLQATIELIETRFLNGETNKSGGRFGSYHTFLPPGSYDIRFAADGYTPQVRSVNITSGSAQVLDIQLSPTVPRR